MILRYSTGLTPSERVVPEMPEAIARIDDGPRESWLKRKAGHLLESGRTFIFEARLLPEHKHERGIDIPIGVHEAVPPAPGRPADEWILRGLLTRDLPVCREVWRKGRPLVIVYAGRSKEGTLHPWGEAAHLTESQLAALADSSVVSVPRLPSAASAGRPSRR